MATGPLNRLILLTAAETDVAVSQPRISIITIHLTSFNTSLSLLNRLSSAELNINNLLTRSAC